MKKASTRKHMTPRQRAEALVDCLMRNGQGEQSERLVLTAQDGRDLGGWGRLPLIDKIERAINEALQDARLD